MIARIRFFIRETRNSIGWIRYAFALAWAARKPRK
jgi:hypothetical protein